MWRGGGGGHSGRMGAWRLAEITRDRIIEELLGILHRSVHPGPVTASFRCRNSVGGGGALVP